MTVSFRRARLLALVVTACIFLAAPRFAASSEATPAAPASDAGPPLVDVAADVGLDFVHQNGRTGELYFHEMMGSGGALFDADGDGDLDVYLVQGGPIGPLAAADAPRPSDRFFRNLLRESGTLRFEDVTDAAGFADATEYGMGTAVGDVDGDGRPDLYVTNFGSNRLWLNRSDGDGPRFVDVTARSGADDPRWSTSATFFDADRDGRLDLFVAHYVSYGLASHKPCRSNTGMPTYCGPHAFSPEPDAFFHNLGTGDDGVPRFAALPPADGASAADRAWPAAAGLGVVAADFDRDGWQDLYVANDQAANHLWRNRTGESGEDGKAGELRFVDDALFAGAALNAEGQPEAGMGIAVADVDADGDPDMVVTHLARETHTLYLNEGDGFFADRTAASGLAAASWDATGFGIAFFDLAGEEGADGRPDLFVANGAVKLIEELVRAGDPFPLHQPNQLFRLEDGPRFEEVLGDGVEVLERSEVSRGVAVGDVDDDGDADLLLTQNGGPVRLLLQPGSGSAWIGLRLLTGNGDGARDALGAEATLVRRGAPDLWRRVDTGGSYLSANDPRILFGLGEGAEIDELRVRWPDGGVESFPASAVKKGRYTTLRQGDGEPLGAGEGSP